MSPEELQQYAATLVLSHATDIEFMSVIEMAEEHLEAVDEISEEDAKKVHDLTRTATVTVSWPDSDLEWSNDDEV